MPENSGFKHFQPTQQPAPEALGESQWAYVLDRVEATEKEVRSLRDGMQASVSAGVVQGIKALAADPEFGAAFWRRGFEHLSDHTTTAVSKGIGSRILTAAALAALSWLVAWLVKTGRI